MNNVLFINDAFDTFTPNRSGAIAIIIYGCCRAAQLDGWAPSVITRPSDVPPFGGIDLIFMEHPFVSTNRWADLAMRAERKAWGYRRLRQGAYIHRVKARVCAVAAAGCPVVTFNDPELAIVLREKFPNLKVVSWFQNQICCREPFRTRLATSGVKLAACSGFTARWVEAAHALESGAVATLYNSADCGEFRPALEPVPLPPVVGFLGRLGHDKGPDVLLDAALELAARGRKFSVQLVGTNHAEGLVMDDYQRRLFAQADELGKLGIGVRRAGHVGRAELPAELRKSHIHVCTSRWDEPFGMATLEGMACGLATVASNTGGTPEVVGDAGFLFERGNVQQLAAHLERLILDETLRREYAAKARRRAEQFTWAKTWAGIRGVITR